MIEILIIMGVGILAGRLLRGKPVIVARVEKAIIWSIYLLLLLLGVAIGSSQQIMSGLSQLGLTALWITLAAVAGSIIMAGLLWKFIFSKSP
ncbi:MAG: LysO family transporter [Bacteroidales bacterium]